MDQPNRRYPVDKPPRADPCAGKEVGSRMQRFTQQVVHWMKVFVNPWIQYLDNRVDTLEDGIDGVNNAWIDATNSSGMEVDCRHNNPQAMAAQDDTVDLALAADALTITPQTQDVDGKGHYVQMAPIANPKRLTTPGDWLAGGVNGNDFEITHADAQTQDDSVTAINSIDVTDTGNPSIEIERANLRADAKGHMLPFTLTGSHVSEVDTLGDDWIDILGVEAAGGNNPRLEFSHKTPASEDDTISIGGLTLSLDAKGHVRGSSGSVGGGVGFPDVAYTGVVKITQTGSVTLIDADCRDRLIYYAFQVDTDPLRDVRKTGSDVELAFIGSNQGTFAGEILDFVPSGNNIRVHADNSDGGKLKCTCDTFSTTIYLGLMILCSSKFTSDQSDTI